MAKEMKRGSIGAKVFGTLLLIVLIVVFTIVCDIGALGTIGDYNEVIGDACLGMERVNGQLGASTQKMQMYTALIHYEQMGDTADVYRSILKTANDQVREYGAELHRLSESTGDETLIAVANTYLLSVSNLSDCAGRLIKAVEAFDRETFTMEATTLSGYVNDMMQKEEEFGAALNTYCQYIMSRSAVRISGTRTFDIIMCSIIAVAAAAGLFVVAKTVSGPARKSRNQVDDIVRKIENDQGDLTERITVSSNDEIGQMAVGVNNFIEQLQIIMRKLKTESENLKNSALAVNNEVSTSNDNASSVSAAMEEMSASMEEISATLGQIASGSDAVMTQIEQMNSHVQDGVRLVRDITNRADEMHHDTLESKEETAGNVESIRRDLNTALTDSRSVEKINELTQDILGISSQTNLLSLNASIEAARAGEQGRGFAVVAQEIGNLASNSSVTARQISDICEEIDSNIANVQNCVDDIIGFMEGDVSRRFQEFVNIAGEYGDSVADIRSTIREIETSSNGFADSAASIRERMGVIQSAAQENEIGVGDIVKKIEYTNAMVEDLENVGRTNGDNAGKIGSLVDQFKQ